MVNKSHKPVLIVIAGPNGSGKTTITHRILRHEWMEGALYVNPDQVAQDRFGDWNSPDAIIFYNFEFYDHRCGMMLHNNNSCEFMIIRVKNKYDHFRPRKVILLQ